MELREQTSMCTREGEGNPLVQTSASRTTLRVKLWYSVQNLVDNWFRTHVKVYTQLSTGHVYLNLSSLYTTQTRSNLHSAQTFTNEYTDLQNYPSSQKDHAKIMQVSVNKCALTKLCTASVQVCAEGMQTRFKK